MEFFSIFVWFFTNWSCGPMDKASDYESGDCRFKSCQDQNIYFFFGCWNEFAKIMTKFEKLLTKPLFFSLHLKSLALKWPCYKIICLHWQNRHTEKAKKIFRVIRTKHDRTQTSNPHTHNPSYWSMIIINNLLCLLSILLAIGGSDIKETFAHFNSISILISQEYFQEHLLICKW